MFFFQEMELFSDSILCIGLMVISLLNISDAEECCQRHIEARGIIREDFCQNNANVYKCCKYHLKAPKGYIAVLNVTELRGFSQIHSRRCIPKLSIRNIADTTPSSELHTICNGGSVQLPLVLTSSKSEMKIVFRWQQPYQTSFTAVFTFHKHQEVESTEDCVFECSNKKCLNSSSLVCDSKDDCGDHSDEIECGQMDFRAASGTFLSTPQSTVQPSGIPDSGTPVPHSSGPVERMGLFILLILAPITIACVCCIVIHYRKVMWRNRHLEQNQHQPVPRSDSSDSSQVRDVRYMATSPEYPSHQRQQEVLAQQRQNIMSRTSETEDFPATITLLDEDDPPHHSNISLHLHNDDEIYREGIRAPPNRIAYESEINNILTYQEQQQKYQGFTSSRAHSLERQRLIIDSKTRAPVSIVDSDLEEPPPYSSTGGPAMNNNLPAEQDMQEAPPAYSDVVTNSCSSSSSAGNSSSSSRPYQNRHANGTKLESSDKV